MISFLLLTALGLCLYAQGKLLGLLLVVLGITGGFYNIHRREQRRELREVSA